MILLKKIEYNFNIQQLLNIQTILVFSDNNGFKNLRIKTLLAEHKKINENKQKQFP